MLCTIRHFEISLVLNSKTTSRSKLKNREGSLHYPWILLSMTHEDVFTYSYLAAGKTNTAPYKTWVITELSWKLAPMIGVPVTVFMISHIWSTYPFKEWISSVVHRIPSSRKEGTTWNHVYLCRGKTRAIFQCKKKEDRKHLEPIDLTDVAAAFKTLARNSSTLALVVLDVIRIYLFINIPFLSSVKKF